MAACTPLSVQQLLHLTIPVTAAPALFQSSAHALASTRAAVSETTSAGFASCRLCTQSILVLSQIANTRTHASISKICITQPQPYVEPAWKATTLNQHGAAAYKLQQGTWILLLLLAPCSGSDSTRTNGKGSKAIRPTGKPQYPHKPCPLN